MKLIALADLHLSENTPPCRPDGEDLIATQARKLNFVADLALQEDVDYILIAGDLFDSWRTNSTEFFNAVHQVADTYGTAQRVSSLSQYRETTTA